MYYKIIDLLVIVCFMLNYSNAQEDQKLFRKDYKYIPSLRGFYKLQTVRKSWLKAEEVCFNDGTGVLRPDNLDKMLEIINVLQFFNGTQPFKPMVNGIQNIIGEEEHGSFDGIPLSELYNHWRPDQSVEYPFICKKTQVSVVWNQECNTLVSGYTYSEETGRCYKFHLDPSSWDDAKKICKQEQSYLAIINSNEEQKVLVKLTERAPKESIMGNYLSGIAHLGFRKNENDVWMTLDGIKLEDSGFALWNSGQPDGPPRGVEEPCGSMFYNGELNDIGCDVRSFFICEHEISTLSSLYGYRIGEPQQ